MPFVHRLRVRFNECDPQGIVFVANYLVYADVAFTELCRAAFGPWARLTDAGYDAVVADVHLAYRGSARSDEEIDVEWSITRLGRSSIESALAFRRGDEVLVTGEMRHTVVAAETWRSTEMPAFARDGLTAMMG